MKKILLFPGAFNPPHTGHMALLKSAVSQEQFDEVWVMPSGRRDDGKVIGINYDHRRNLNSLFTKYLQENIHIPVVFITAELDDIEDVGTKEIIRRIKSTSGTDIVQLIGSDAYRSLLNHRLIIDGEKFLVFKRGGDSADFILREGDQLINVTLPQISSTTIRELVRNSDSSYKMWVIKEIAEYIDSNNLYK